MSTRTIRCPRCQEKTEWEGNPYRPFCSERCRLIDLGNWSDESYKIPTAPHDNVIPFPKADSDEE